MSKLHQTTIVRFVGSSWTCFCPCPQW